MDVDKWVKQQLELLCLEKNAESQELSQKISQMTAKHAQEAGVSILDLAIGENLIK